MTETHETLYDISGISLERALRPMVEAVKRIEAAWREIGERNTAWGVTRPERPQVEYPEPVFPSSLRIDLGGRYFFFEWSGGCVDVEGSCRRFVERCDIGRYLEPEMLLDLTSRAELRALDAERLNRVDEQACLDAERHGLVQRDAVLSQVRALSLRP